VHNKYLNKLLTNNIKQYKFNRQIGGNYMKNVILILILCLNVSILYSQDIFTGDITSNIDFERILNYYNYSISDFLGLFRGGDAIKILLGDKDLLNNRLSIFALAHLNKDYLRLLRNMIYARYGYRFNSPDLNAYFGQFKWYTPRRNNVDNYFTLIDKQNIERIQAFENMNENLPNIIWNTNNKVGVWDWSIAMAAGWSDRFVIHSTNQLEYYFSQMSNLDISYGMNGTYTIKGNVLEYCVTEIFIRNTGRIIFDPINGYDWDQRGRNTIRFDPPIIYKFPITDIHIREYGINGTELKHETIAIGGINFHRFKNNVNNKF
jgi:hypothetical protein